MVPLNNGRQHQPVENIAIANKKKDSSSTARRTSARRGEALIRHTGGGLASRDREHTNVGEAFNLFLPVDSQRQSGRFYSQQHRHCSHQPWHHKSTGANQLDAKRETSRHSTGQPRHTLKSWV